MFWLHCITDKWLWMKGKADMLKYVMHFLFFTFNEFSFLLKSVVYQLLPLTKSGNLHKIMKFSPYMTLTCYSVSLSYFVIRPKKALLLTWEKKPCRTLFWVCGGRGERVEILQLFPALTTQCFSAASVTLSNISLTQLPFYSVRICPGKRTPTITNIIFQLSIQQN